MENRGPVPTHLRLTGVSPKEYVDEDVVAGVVWAAIRIEGQRLGITQKMVDSLNRGADKTEEGPVSGFLFQAMVDRLLEEFHAGEAQIQEKRGDPG